MITRKPSQQVLKYMIFPGLSVSLASLCHLVSLYKVLIEGKKSRDVLLEICNLMILKAYNLFYKIHLSLLLLNKY